MIRKEQAVALKYRAELFHATLRGSDKRPVRCRVNGTCRTWKTRPDDFMLPVKHGLRQCFYIDPTNADEWHTTEEAALKGVKS